MCLDDIGVGRIGKDDNVVYKEGRYRFYSRYEP